MVLFEPDFVNFWLAVMTQGSRVELAVTRMRKLSDLTWEKDGALNQTSFAYTRGRVSQVTDEAAKNRSFTYDSSNNKMQTTDERGYNWGPTYDSAGNVLTSKNPYNATTNFSYDNFNLQTWQVNANGRIVTFDSANRTADVLQKSSTSATLAHYVYAYYGVNNVTTRTDTDGTVTTFGCANGGQVTSEVRGGGSAYTNSGQPCSPPKVTPEP